MTLTVLLTVQDTNVLVTWESSNTVDVHHWEICRGVDPNSLSTCFDSTGTAEQMKSLKEIAPKMLEEWSQTKRPPKDTAWLHEKEFKSK